MSDSVSNSLRDEPLISRLSDDVLHEIFHFVASSSFVSEDQRLQRLGSIPISHVCRYWRTLCLRSPQLWSFLHLSPRTKVQIVREFVARSENALLSIRIRGPSTVWEPVDQLAQMADIISSHCARFLEFYIVGFLPDHMEAILKPFVSPAAELQRLGLHAGGYMKHAAPFLGWMPKLQYVTISEIRVPWLPYEGLVELDISYQSIPSLDELLWTLRRSPLLETLSLNLRGSLKTKSSADPPDTSPILLGKLRVLSLGSNKDADDLLRLLACLTFPATTSVSLQHTNGCYRHPVDIGELCPSVRNIASGVSRCFLQYISSHGSCNHALKSEDASVELLWSWMEGEDDVAHVGLAALKLPALRSLVILTYSFDMRGTEWLQVLRRAPTVETLEIDFRIVQETTVLAFFDALAGRMDDGTIVCPNLVRFVIVRVGDADRAVWERLVSVLVSRAGAGAPNLVSLEILSRKGWSPTLLPEVFGSTLNGLVGEITLEASQLRFR